MGWLIRITCRVVEIPVGVAIGYLGTLATYSIVNSLYPLRNSDLDFFALDRNKAIILAVANIVVFVIFTLLQPSRSGLRAGYRIVSPPAPESSRARSFFGFRTALDRLLRLCLAPVSLFLYLGWILFLFLYLPFQLFRAESSPGPLSQPHAVICVLSVSIVSSIWFHLVKRKKTALR